MTINQLKPRMLLLLCLALALFLAAGAVMNAYAQFQAEDFQHSRDEPDPWPAELPDELPPEAAPAPFTAEPNLDDFPEQGLADFELAPFEPVFLDETTPDTAGAPDNQMEEQAIELEAIDILVPDTTQQSLGEKPEIDEILKPDKTLEKQALDAPLQALEPARRQPDSAPARSAKRRRSLPEFLRASNKAAATKSRRPRADPVIQIRQRVQKIGIVRDAKTGELKEVLLNAGSITDQDTLLFSMRCRNISKTAAQQVVITYPLPESVLWLEGSTTGANTSLFYSTDAGYSFAAFEQLLTGFEHSGYLVSNESVTHIRWVYNVPFRPGQSRLLTFRAKLASVFSEP